MGTSASSEENAKVMLEIFGAIERRDAGRFAALVHPDFEICWPESLPYGGTYRDLDADANQGRPTWGTTWQPLQPTVAERRMDPRVVATSDDGQVVVAWRQRGRRLGGERLDAEVLGWYQLREAKLARAQMFYFDTVAVARFLASA